jgi:hypothetical protein
MAPSADGNLLAVVTPEVAISTNVDLVLLVKASVVSSYSYLRLAQLLWYPLFTATRGRISHTRIGDIRQRVMDPLVEAQTMGFLILLYQHKIYQSPFNLNFFFSL